MSLALGTHEVRLSAARIALEGLSVGDALGQSRHGAPPPWRYSDDTEMAIASLEVFGQHRGIDQDALAAAFARHFEADPERGYGAVAYWLLFQLTMGHDWRAVSRQVFKGQGSLGNGGAMRVAPIGAYFGDDVAEVARRRNCPRRSPMHIPMGRQGRSPWPSRRRVRS